MFLFRSNAKIRKTVKKDTTLYFCEKYPIPNPIGPDYERVRKVLELESVRTYLSEKIGKCLNWSVVELEKDRIIWISKFL